jgi:hypothetical protein
MRKLKRIVFFASFRENTKIKKKKTSFRTLACYNIDSTKEWPWLSYSKEQDTRRRDYRTVPSFQLCRRLPTAGALFRKSARLHCHLHGKTTATSGSLTDIKFLSIASIFKLYNTIQIQYLYCQLSDNTINRNKETNID